MKHIKHKFLEYEIGGQSVHYVFNTAVPTENMELNSEEQVIMMKYENDNHFTYAFTYNFKGGTIVIPEPDLVVCLFEVSRNYCVDMAKLKVELLSNGDSVDHIRLNSFKFYASATLSITTLYNCLEAFLNRLIPPDFVYTGTVSYNKDLLWDKDNIERFLGLEDKIKAVIPQINGLSFHTQFGDKYDKLKKLKNIRNAMTHIKAAFGLPDPIYSKLYLNALDFDYLGAINAVRAYIEFYRPNLIETCDCGQDY